VRPSAAPGREIIKAIKQSLLLAACITAGTALADDSLDIREWQVPYEQSRPHDPYAESDSSVWFVGQRTGYLAHLNANSGEITQVQLKDGSGPHNLIVGSDGTAWYAGNLNRLIGRYDPALSSSALVIDRRR
jgi:virginiamycin B lyase